MATVRIIAAFPGTGKTYLGNKNADKYIDMECSAFAKARQISIYTAAIITDHKTATAVQSLDTIYILISTHQQVRTRLAAAGLEVELVYPDRKLKYEYLHRYKKRGTPAKSISHISANWHDYLSNMQRDKHLKQHRLAAGEFLSDVI